MSTPPPTLAEVVAALRLILPLAKGYAPEGQTARYELQASRT